MVADTILNHLSDIGWKVRCFFQSFLLILWMLSTRAAAIDAVSTMTERCIQYFDTALWDAPRTNTRPMIACARALCRSRVEAKRSLEGVLPDLLQEKRWTIPSFCLAILWALPWITTGVADHQWTHEVSCDKYAASLCVKLVFSCITVHIYIIMCCPCVEISQSLYRD